MGTSVVRTDIHPSAGIFAAPTARPLLLLPSQVSADAAAKILNFGSPVFKVYPMAFLHREGVYCSDEARHARTDA